ncbi:hypothetical protein MKW98_007367 [Papaver atlanticum]|uniref:Uncharacterized protein n=1 Tax=Papaver atlanticum TaxID=357466 RepID=A0AAD4SBC0_9MAGN|nr:hypothetical protein MKW98_007367 [Papaver atlanticum]
MVNAKANSLLCFVIFFVSIHQCQAPQEYASFKIEEAANYVCSYTVYAPNSRITTFNFNIFVLMEFGMNLITAIGMKYDSSIISVM